jgi:hypothetical protein
MATRKLAALKNQQRQIHLILLLLPPLPRLTNNEQVYLQLKARRKFYAGLFLYLASPDLITTFLLPMTVYSMPLISQTGNIL